MAITWLVVLSGIARPARSGQVRVCIQPLKPYDRDLQEVVRQGIVHVFGFEVRVLDPVRLPKKAYYAARKRYRAEKLLDFLDGFAGADKGCQIVVGFTRADISTTKEPHADWGVFGLGAIGGPSCVVSTARLGHGLGKPSLLAKRTVKVVNHELGHALGLDHHPTAGCLMEDAKGTIRTVDRESGQLCVESRMWISKTYGVQLQAHQAIDWKLVLGDYPAIARAKARARAKAKAKAVTTEPAEAERGPDPATPLDSGSETGESPAGQLPKE